MAKDSAGETAFGRGLTKWARGQTRITRALTCGKDSSHPYLKPKLEGNKIVLVCPWPGCGYTKERIPKILLAESPTIVRGKTVIISKKDWRALLKGERVKILRLFSRGELHHEFGDKPEEYIERVKIIPVETL